MKLAWVARVSMNVTLAVVSTMTALWLLEWTVTRINPYVPFFLFPSTSNCMQRTRLLSLEFRPSCTGFLADTHFHTNALGLRGDEIRDDGSIRVLAIGDSCTWGWAVGDDEAYPKRLEQRLNHRWGDGRYQVINAGVPGYTSYQGLLYLRERGLQLHPDLVLVAFGFNDATLDGDVIELIAQQARWLPILELDDMLIGQSHAYQWLRWKAQQRRGDAPQIPRVTADNYEHNLREIVTLARAHGATVVLVGFNAGFKYGAARKAVAQSMQVPLVIYGGPKLDLVHPTADGYVALVDNVVDRMTNEGILESLQARTAEAPREQ